MSRRPEEQDEEEPVSKRVKTDDDDSAAKPDEDAEWEAFEKIINETKSAHANGTAKESNDRTNIELDEEPVPSDEEKEDEEEEQVHDTWDEEEVKIERRREEHRKRREYLDKIRADRAKRIEEKAAVS